MSTTHHAGSNTSKSPETNGTCIFGSIPRQLEDQIWSLVPAGSGPRFIEIIADPTIRPYRDQDGRLKFGEKQFEIRIKTPGKSLTPQDSTGSSSPATSFQALNSRAANLSHNRFSFDYKIKNPHIVNIAQDIFFFNGLDTLEGYVDITRAIIIKSATLDSQPHCYPTIQNIVVLLCLNMGDPGSGSYASWLKHLRSQTDFHRFILKLILPELLQSISKAQGLKKIYLLVNKEEIPGEGLIERVNCWLMNLLAEDDELRRGYGDNFKITEVFCLTMNVFTRKFGRVSRRLGGA